MATLNFAIFESSMGYIVLVARDGKVISLDIREEGFYEAKKAVSSCYPDAVESSVVFKTLRTLLDRYLRGIPVDFNVEVDLSSRGTFDQRVLSELRNIPHGEVRSYGWLAAKLGDRGAARAVGQALKRNPIPIIIPCHRVIRGDGDLGGYSMGIRIKERLLHLEGVRILNARGRSVILRDKDR
ncbi:MAG: Methylated-DNA--protein-cysteine methyltransferase [Syntrophorhabdus sp. PtaU1.Bin153]|nr:MAG: Methylated-DNA--protein-cysteine methyltransferase [Syntrophorhabdus sp. PtaU1.Bin153]